LNILAVIPARGNSKGIPRKNMRLINGNPLLYYSIKTAQNCGAITHIAVSSDDEEILEYAKEMGIYPIQRDASLAEDAVTLDPVIFDTVIQMEKKLETNFDCVVTMQPTSPLLTSAALNKAIETFIHENIDTMLSAVNKPCLSWRKESGTIVPNYIERLNRQQLPPCYVEAGAFVICKRTVLSETTRIGKNVSVYELSEQEGIDIDTADEWVLAETILKRKKIIFRADGDRNLGMGHIYRALTLAYSLTGHEISFVCNKNYGAGIKKINDSFFPCFEIENENDFKLLLKQFAPDILVMDILDTEEKNMLELKKYCNRLVTFEDKGSGTNVADAVINALYTQNDGRPHVYSGYKYADLRDEFLLREPKEFSTMVTNIFVMFGGADPANLTQKVYNTICNNPEVFKGITVNFITGLAYDSSRNNIIDRPNDNIFVYNNAKNVSKFMQQADLAIGSMGRTSFELVSMAIPSVVIAQNEKEKTHSFTALGNGFLNLGLGEEISEETILKTLVWLISTPQVRKEMHQIMRSFNVRKGISRIKKIILGETV